MLAVIELDDASHKGREARDSKRDAMLERAGHRVLRFKNVPDVDAVQRAVRNAMTLSRSRRPMHEFPVSPAPIVK